MAAARQEKGNLVLFSEASVVMLESGLIGWMKNMKIIYILIKPAFSSWVLSRCVNFIIGNYNYAG